MLTNMEYHQMRTQWLNTIVEGTKEAGGLPPQITFFVRHKDGENENEPAMVFYMLRDEYINSDEGKDYFIKKVLPEMAENIKKKFDVHAIGWTAEAWLRETKTDEPVPDNFRDIPIKKEVIVVNFEQKDCSECVIYEMKRNGHKVNQNGVFIDNIELEMIEYNHTTDARASGRFTGMIDLFI